MSSNTFCQQFFVYFYLLGCETGTYDISCSKTCSHCKNSETCDIDTGECDDNGCAIPGFKSSMCSGKLLKQGHFLCVITVVSTPICVSNLLRQYNI